MKARALINYYRGRDLLPQERAAEPHLPEATAFFLVSLMTCSDVVEESPF
jgi:hypothetical protein